MFWLDFVVSLTALRLTETIARDAPPRPSAVIVETLDIKTPTSYAKFKSPESVV